VFPAVVKLMKGSEESLKRECAFVLANPWSTTVGVSYATGLLLLQEGLVQVRRWRAFCELEELLLGGCMR